MFGKSKKTVDAPITESQVQQEKCPDESEVQTSVSESQQPEAGNRFVIKRKQPEEVKPVLQKADLRQLIERYPFLETVKGLDELKYPMLVISEQAENEMKEHISWNRKTRDNVCEQGGILIGKPYLVENSILGVVEHIIPAKLRQASPAYLEMGTDTWAKMLDVYDTKYKDEGLYIIGWFHTHPNNLPVFMSSTDMGTQRSFFNQDWHFSVVLNPHRRLIACFHSAQADRCDYYPADFTE